LRGKKEIQTKISLERESLRERERERERERKREIGKNNEK